MRIPPLPPLDAAQDPWRRVARDATLGGSAAERPPRGLGADHRMRDASIGPRSTWRATFAWEGDDVLRALQALHSATHAPLEITAFLSESRGVRTQLAERIRELAVAKDWNDPNIRVRSAYKPAYHWLVEEVLAHPATGEADTLRLAYPIVPPEPAGRFLHELYPLSAKLEQLGLQFEPHADETLPRSYRAQLRRGGHVLVDQRCDVPLHQRVTPSGETVLAPTGHLRVRAGTVTLLDERFPTDAERVWDWYLNEVLPQVTAALHPPEPSIRNLSITLDVSEADEALGVAHERSSMTEALAEDLYFTTLEALKHHAGHDLNSRDLQPGRIVPVVRVRDGLESRARVALTLTRPAPPTEFQGEPLAASRAPEEIPAQPGPLPDGPARPADLWGCARHLADFHRLTWGVPAYSYDGRPIPAVVRRGLSPALLVTAGQHANEASGPPAALQLLDVLATESALAFAVIPLENPDGAALHVALARTAPEHMHHAARYTSLGDDLEARVTRGDARWEARARVWAAHEIHPRLHLSLHGYPSHEWTRPFSGYAPRGFEPWSIPVGFLTIIRHTEGEGEAARQLAHVIAARLDGDAQVAQLTRDALRWSGAHVQRRHFELVNGWPFILQPRDDLLAPLVVITEAPDETVYGEAFRNCVRAQVLVGRACMQWLEAPEIA